MKNSRLVYSTDPKDKVVCSVCKEYVDECKCAPSQSVEGAKFTVIFRIEKNGRGGKTVTVMDGFPKNESYLQGLTKELKVKCGTGGSFSIGAKCGIIEIQGDKRDQLKKHFESKGIKYKGV